MLKTSQFEKETCVNPMKIDETFMKLTKIKKTNVAQPGIEPGVASVIGKSVRELQLV